MNAVLLWRVLRRLEIPGSWCAAAIFALHPVHVESVAWITEFKNLLSALFSLLSLLAFLRFHPLSASGTGATRNWRFYAPALLLFVCALLSKTAVCCLPVAIAVLLWWKLDRVGKWDILALLPWFAASLALGLITMRVESRLPEADTTSLALSIVQRGLLAGRALWFYAGKVFWPHALTFIYPRWTVDAGAAWQYLFPGGALAVVVALWVLRRQIGNGPLAGVLCFAAMLFPVLGFFNIYFFSYSYVTDHFQYLASIGLIALAVSAGATLADRAGRRLRDFRAVAAGVVLLALGVSTWRQAHVYYDLDTLWRDTLAKNPSAWLAHNNLGVALQLAGKLQDAIGHYHQALGYKPGYVDALTNLGNALREAGKAREAIEYYEQVLRIDPEYAVAHYNLGSALEEAGRVQEAIGHYEHTLRLKPDFAEAHNNLGNALRKVGRPSEAIEHYEQALRVKPDYVKAYNNLGNALREAGRVTEAIEYYEQALRIKPDYAVAHYNLGVSLEQAGRAQEAIGHYEQALRLKPDFAEAQNGLARLRTVR